MKLVRTEEAVGQVLCHDITQIIRDISKGPVFRKGHIVTEEDIPVLLSLGKEHLYVWEKDAFWNRQETCLQQALPPTRRRRSCGGSARDRI